MNPSGTHVRPPSCSLQLVLMLRKSVGDTRYSLSFQDEQRTKLPRTRRHVTGQIRYVARTYKGETRTRRRAHCSFEPGAIATARRRTGLDTRRDPGRLAQHVCWPICADRHVPLRPLLLNASLSGPRRVRVSVVVRGGAPSCRDRQKPETAQLPPGRDAPR
jgi:hypothetical protein